MSKQHEIEALISPTIEALGLELLGVEYVAGVSSALLRIYIDVADRPVNLDDCETVSREVSAILDVNDPIESHYTLEVSSPGLARPLFRPQHFARFAGEQAKIAVDLPIDGRRRFQGAILRVEGDDIVIDQDGVEVRLAHSNVSKAKLVPVYEAPAKPGKAPRKNPGRAAANGGSAPAPAGKKRT
jgi:ribosome maturation factor RimP